MSKMPKQKPHRSEQDVATPPDLMEAVVGRFGPIAFDLAATRENQKAGRDEVQIDGEWRDPWFTPEQDSLKQDWTKLSGTLWLNPPYGDIAPWAAKCAMSQAFVQRDERRRDRHDWRLLLLVPASVGTEWFADHIHGRARVHALSPRVTFVGHDQAYPKDLILAVYDDRAGFDLWRWNDRRTS